MKKFLFLAIALVMSVGSAWADLNWQNQGALSISPQMKNGEFAPGTVFYTIQNKSRNAGYISSNSLTGDVLNTGTQTTKDDYAQWAIIGDNTNGFMFVNRQTKQAIAMQPAWTNDNTETNGTNDANAYLGKLAATDAENTRFAITTHAASAASGYFVIAHNTVNHAYWNDRSGKLGYWYTSNDQGYYGWGKNASNATGDNGASWKLETADAILADGVKFTLKNKQHNLYLGVNAAGTQLSSTSECTEANTWTLKIADGGYKLYNESTGKYAGSITSRNGAITVTDEASAGVYAFEFTTASFITLKCAASTTGYYYFHQVDWGGNAVVDWNANSDASHWAFCALESEITQYNYSVEFTGDVPEGAKITYNGTDYHSGDTFEAGTLTTSSITVAEIAGYTYTVTISDEHVITVTYAAKQKRFDAAKRYTLRELNEGRGYLAYNGVQGNAPGLVDVTMSGYQNNHPKTTDANYAGGINWLITEETAGQITLYNTRLHKYLAYNDAQKSVFTAEPYLLNYTINNNGTIYIQSQDNKYLTPACGWGTDGCVLFNPNKEEGCTNYTIAEVAKKDFTLTITGAEGATVEYEGEAHESGYTFQAYEYEVEASQFTPQTVEGKIYEVTVNGTAVTVAYSDAIRHYTVAISSEKAGFGETITIDGETYENAAEFDHNYITDGDEVTVNDVPDYMTATVNITEDNVINVNVHYAYYHATTRATELQDGKKYMLFNTCYNGAQDRTGFVYGAASVTHEGVHTNPLASKFEQKYLWTVTHGEGTAYNIKNVVTGKFYNGEGVGSDAEAVVYIQPWTSATITKAEANSYSVLGDVVQNADITAAECLFAIGGSETGHSGNNCWNGNPESFAKWENSHPWAFYEVCGIEEAIGEDVLNAVKAYAEHKVAQNPEHTRKYGTFNEANMESVNALSETSTFDEYLTAFNGIVSTHVVAPQPGSFIRVKGHVSGNYVAPGIASAVTNDASRNAMVADADQTAIETIIWYSEAGEFIGYKSGLGMKETFNPAAVGNAIDKQTFSASTYGENALTLSSDYAAGSKIFYDGTTSVNRNSSANGNNCAWYAYDVESLPVAFHENGLGFATLYAPVALEIPDGIKAYVVSEATDHNLKLAEISDVIPAETAVILKGTAGVTENFPITTPEAFVGTNLLRGTIATIAAPEHSLVLAVKTGAEAPGFYGAGATVAGFKAYYVAAAESVSGLAFDFGTESIQNAINALQGGRTYDLQGRQVNNNVRGLFIQNGKKVIK